MTLGPERWSGDHEPERTWAAKPLAAASLRLLLLVGPFMVGWFVVNTTQEFYLQTQGWLGLGLWILQAVIVATATTAVAARIAERFTPLPVLLGMTLIFPDHAPSRFAIALRAGSARHLIGRPGRAASVRPRTPSLTAGDPQRAAEEALALITSLRDHEPGTRGHTERVRACAELIGQELDLSEADINGLRWGMLLHDIGKLGVPAELLSKPGAPTDEEWQILKTHPSIGGEIVKPLEPWLGTWTLAASQHHERWDGSGYPAGLSHTSITLAARIAAVADAYDVMTSRRSYKSPRSPDAARRELVACSGSHFDPNVVRAFLRSGLVKPTNRLGSWSWIMELPGVARLGGAIASGPITALPAAVAVLAVAVPGTASVVPPADLTFSAEATVAIEDERDSSPETVLTTSSATNSTMPGDESDATIVFQDEPGAVPQTPPADTADPTEPNATPVPDETAPPTTMSPTSTTTIVTTAPTTTIPSTPCEQMLAGETELPGLDLAGCNFGGLPLDGLDLTNANLTNADLSGAVITGFNLSGADLTGANLTQSELRDGSLVGADLSNVSANGLVILRVDLGSITATGADFQNASFAQMSFGFATVTSSSFVGATFQGANFNDGVISGSDFGSATMNGTEFWRTNATSARFVGAQLEGAVFGSTDLTKAELAGTNLRYSNLDQANLTQAGLASTDLFGAGGTPAFSAATFDATICPNGAVQSTNCW